MQAFKTRDFRYHRLREDHLRAKK